MSAATTTAVLARLRTATNLLVGDARKPDGGGWQGAPGQSAFRTYLVLYAIDAQRMGGQASLDDRLSAPQWHYQTTAVGRDRLSAETASDLAARALLGGPVAVPDVGVVQVRHDASLGPTADEDVNPPLFIAIERFRLDTSPP